MRTNRRGGVAGLELAFSAVVSSGAEAQPHPVRPIVVNNTRALEKALVDANAGRRIVVQKGTYSVAQTLTVPDGATLEGEGRMVGGVSPVGFAPGGVTAIVAASGLDGDVLRLGNGASLRNLKVEDVLRGPNRAGNVIGVVSRREWDVVAASIVDCEILNPNAGGPPGPDGPTAGGI